MEPSPPLRAVERFRRDMAALEADAGARVGIAVSGGPDSLALLLLAHESLRGRVEASTVDHRLRSAGAAEAGFVARVCAELGIPHRTLTPDTPIEGNLQAGARAHRYRLLARWAKERGLAAIATAHHVEDQAETLLMRLVRGAGLPGLAGIRPAGQVAGVRVVRPLLSWRREELAAIVAASGLTPVADPSNSDNRYDRSRIRRRLAQNGWLEPEPLARSAGALADAEAALAWATERLWAERGRNEQGKYRLDPSDLPQELRRRLLLKALGALGAEGPRGEAVQRLLATLAAGETATLAGVKCIGGETWRFEQAPPRRGAGQPE
jgi:tRNA(Ile)-lysidine synthase